MPNTKNDIAPVKRKKISTYLNQLLSDAIDLKSQAKQAHWNVKGENFIALHELFDTVSTQADAAVDLIAERIVQLGDVAMGTVRVAAKTSRLKEYPIHTTDSTTHVEALSSAIAVFNANSRKGIDETGTLGDAVTADMLTGITREHDKLLWFVESHIPAVTRTASKKTG
jgi:starvation-inducible DNA-binding protein